MSLFKAREWWSTTSGYEEFHDTGCLCVANIDNSTAGHDKIVVGSFQGLVRIYRPHPPTFSPDHVLMEKQLPAPVLQVAVGRFAQDTQLLHLALLHPRDLSVHSFTISETDEGEQYSLTQVYQHHLERTACNMTFGPFGGARGSDYICVQSMDGQLSFFHQESAAFSCFLPDFLIPGPMKYIPRTDSLITANSAHMLQAFRYQTLAVAGTGGQGSGEDRQSGPTSGKKIVADWSVNIGEHTIDICVITRLDAPSQILVLGERSVFCFKESGKLKFMKKLDFNPSCIHAYSILAGKDGLGVVQYLVASHTNQLLVFKDSTLIWAARLIHPPADITVANFQALNGVIVSLDELGHLTCSYLGTDPSVFSAPMVPTRDLNYEDLDKEMKELQQVIRQSLREGTVVNTDATLVVKTTVEPAARIVELPEGEKEGRIQKCIEVKLHLSPSSNTVLKDITVSVSSTLPLSTHPSHLHYDKLSTSQPHTPDTITIVCTPDLLPTNRNITISATYSTLEGLPRVSTATVSLPLSLFCETCQPEKAAQYKITLDTNHPAVALPSLFQDLQVNEREGEGPQNALGLKLLSGPVVTLVASKSSERYRLQSDSFPAISVLLGEVVERLEQYHDGKVPVFKMSYSGSLPLNEYFEIIERHYKLRSHIEHCQELLSRHAQQFRAIQKRLLTRFKDKTPVGLAHLDTLLDGTYMQLMALGEKNEMFQLELFECSNELSCATLIINTLLRLSVQMTPEDYAILEASLSPVVVSDCEQGWEEHTDAAITNLLRTALAKSTRDQAVPISAVELPADSQRLKRHIALLCDCISKGGTLGGRPKETTTATTTQSLPQKSEGKVKNGPSKPEVLSWIQINHSAKKTPRLPSLPEDSLESHKLPSLPEDSLESDKLPSLPKDNLESEQHPHTETDL